MSIIIQIISVIAILAASMLVGNMFLGEIKKAKAQKLPWYKPYLTLPGIIVMIAIIAFPFVIKFSK